MESWLIEGFWGSCVRVFWGVVGVEGLEGGVDGGWGMLFWGFCGGKMVGWREEDRSIGMRIAKGRVEPGDRGSGSRLADVVESLGLGYYYKQAHSIPTLG